MKKIKLKKGIIFSVILILVVILPLVAAGSFEDVSERLNKKKYVSISTGCEIDSVETLKSDYINFEKYGDFNAIDTPILFHYSATVTDTVTDSINVSVILYGSYNNSDFFAWDTLATIAQTNSLSATETEIDLNSKKYPYGKIHVIGNTGNMDNILLDMSLNYFLKRENWE